MAENINVSKIVSLEPSIKKQTKTVATEKAKVKRVITATKKWIFNTNDLIPENQYASIHDNSGNNILFVERQIAQKISGYRSQDIEKNLLSPELFVNKNDVFALFQSSQLKCYYCKECVLVLYEHVRDPKQWTLERIDNSRGHNRDNVEIACLHCNVRRRCMKPEKYILTKQMSNVVKI